MSVVSRNSGSSNGQTCAFVAAMHAAKTHHIMAMPCPEMTFAALRYGYGPVSPCALETDYVFLSYQLIHD
jgi:hypothetical protein